MRIELKPWNKSRVGNVILFVMLTLFFGYASIIIFGTLLSGDKEFRDWPYLLSPLIAAVFAWLLCITLSPKHQSCMDAVKGEMTFRELKKRVESEEYEEPLVFSPYFGEDGELHETTYRMLISENWVLLGHDMDNPLCIPKDRVRKATVIHVAYEDLGSEQPEHEPLCLYFELANGKKFVTGGFASEHLDEVKKMVCEHFPNAEFEGYSQASI